MQFESKGHVQPTIHPFYGSASWIFLLPPVTRPIDRRENPAIGVSLNPKLMLDGALLGTFTDAPRDVHRTHLF